MEILIQIGIALVALIVGALVTHILWKKSVANKSVEILREAEIEAEALKKDRILQAKEKLYQSDLSINQSSFQNYDLYAGMEKEPDQSILRLGVNIPLSIHNDRSEERMLAKLQGQQTKLEREQLSLNVDSQKQMLKVSIRELSAQYYALKMLQKEQQELTSLLQEG